MFQRSAALPDVERQRGTAQGGKAAYEDKAPTIVGPHDRHGLVQAALPQAQCPAGPMETRRKTPDTDASHASERAEIARTLGGRTGGNAPHKRELKVFSPVKPHATPSCHLPLMTAMWTRSLFQPGPHSGFLMASTPRPTAQKAAQAGQTRLDPGLPPRALHLLPHGVQPQPAQQPTAHHH